MLSRMPEDILNTSIQQNKDSLQKVISRYRSGLLTEDECRSICKEILYKVIIADYNDQIPHALISPLPDDLITPDIHAGHFPTDLVIGWNIWRDGKATLEEALQSKTPVILTDHNGLKTRIKLIQGPKADVPPSQVHGYTEYIGTGTIEGYTSDRPRKISITVNEDGQIRSLFTRQDCDDTEAFRNFPLWKDYHQKMQELEQKENEIITKLMQE